MNKPKPFFYHTRTKSYDMAGVFVIGRAALPLVFPITFGAIAAVVSAIWGVSVASYTEDWSAMFPFYGIVAAYALPALLWLLIHHMRKAAYEVRRA